MLVFLGFLLILVAFYVGSSWFIVLKYHTHLFFNDYEDLTFFGKAIFWYVKPFIWVWMKFKGN